MKLWMSSEAMQIVGSDLSRVSNFAETVINEKLVSINFQIDGVDEWAVIAMVLEDNPILSEYKEIQRFHRKGKVLEYRLRIDYQAFLNSDDLGKVQLFFDMLLRSVDLMATKKIPQAKIDILKEVCLEAIVVVKAGISKVKIPWK